MSATFRLLSPSKAPKRKHEVELRSYISALKPQKANVNDSHLVVCGHFQQLLLNAPKFGVTSLVIYTTKLAAINILRVTTSDYILHSKAP